MTERTVRILDRDITRRDVVKAGGVAGIGLVFASPAISAVRPVRAFASDYEPSCASTPLIQAIDTGDPSQAKYMIEDAAGIATIKVDFLSGDEAPDIVIKENNVKLFDQSNWPLPFTYSFDDCPDPVEISTSIKIKVDVDDNEASSYSIEVTNCCGNSETVAATGLVEV